MGANLPEATIFFSGENKWRQFNSWPAKEASIANGYLQKNGKLSFQKTISNPLTYSEYISDPDKPVPYTEDVHTGRTREYMTDDQRFAARRPDVLVFETETLTSDVTVAGSIVANLCVSISSRDADFIVKLIDVFPDDFENNPPSNYIMNGYQMLVRGEVMRGKFRNSLEKAEPFIPNQITRFQYALPDVAHTFKKGHKLMIQIQSSWFPLVDRNPQQFMNIYQATSKDFTKAAIKVYHNESYISLPILK
jgi:putative CocE/NonD family hydrolase